MDEILRRIDSFAELPEDWDSYGSRKIDPRAITAAKAFVSRLFAVPVNGGGIQLEAELPNGWSLEVVIPADGESMDATVFDNDINVVCASREEFKIMDAKELA